MSSVTWTKDQQKVIDLRNRNILVSAAAGSGKTAVLVERIITMITDSEHPVDIDRLLIVTFTNAAAAEMRDRIGAAIEKKLDENPDHVHLQKQMALIHSAQITTIHSFCLNVIRNYFNTIDLDPSFRIAEEAELKLLQSDVISNLLERHYEEGSEEFTKLVECYAAGKSDAMLEELIVQLYRFSISYPWPFEWLEEKKKAFTIESMDEMEQSEWMKVLLDYIHAVLRDICQSYEEAIDLCRQPAGPIQYEGVLDKEEQMATGLLMKKTYQELYEAFQSISFDRLPSKRDKSVDEGIKTMVKEMRDKNKKVLTELKKSYFFQSPDEMLTDIQGVKDTMNTLINLAMEFSQSYKEEKEERGIVDFNDLEHFALHILVKQENGEVVPTEVALELSDFYEELLIDEYQDSNFVQETILNSISKEKFEKPNMFMVGDVKQSIYKFRMARPELFMGKFHSYSTTDSDYQRIDLHKNFRSRKEVLEPINFIFQKIMREELGNITYDEEARLNPGASFEETDENCSKTSELLLVGEARLIDGVEEESTGSMEDFTKKELEAKAVAKRIKELIDPKNGLKVVKKGAKEGESAYRLVQLSDIVILFRTMSGWSDVFVDVLMSEGINAFAETQSGYFSTIEIRTILNMLRVIDNPRQEIPLAAVLHSPMYEFSNEELALLKINQKERELYDCLLLYKEEGEKELLKEKIEAFLSSLDNYRNMISYMPIYEVIQHVIEDRGYYYYIQSMPAGNRRASNVDMLIQRAIDFESTSFSGLFDFIRYIEKLEKYEIDFGEANVSSENDQAVRIMSIHKSKGLEFPVVFVAGMGKSFNNQDANSSLILHPDLGVGPDFIDATYRIKSPTLIKKVMQKTVVLENLSEELRVLYVALTRAKEKLIMTGFVKNLEKKLESYAASPTKSHERLSYQQLSSASNYLDWVIPCCMGHPSFVHMLETYVECVTKEVDQESIHIPISVSCMDVFDLMKEEVKKGVVSQWKKDDLLAFDETKTYNESIKEQLLAKLQYVYPYKMDAHVKSKVTVSELKKMGQFIDTDESVPLLEERTTLETIQLEPTIPRFVKEENQDEKVVAAALGTLYHKVLQWIDFGAIHCVEDVNTLLQQLQEQKRLTTVELESLNPAKIYSFIEHPIAKRMANANQQGRLKREQPFVLGQPASSINPQFTSNEMVLVQGIIDAFWEEEDGVVLLDYKTDRVTNKDALIKRYRTQLDYYKKAIEKVTHKQVKEVYLYSFSLNEAIKVN